jgi:omega-hydroxy-beta-dihydromenaquinone-9 sulfotransferase
MGEERRPSHTEHPVALGSFRSWMHLVRTHSDIDRAYVPRLLFVSFMTLLTSPLRRWEEMLYGRRIRQTAIHPAPVFIVGHWRSGTTHLHNLLCCDKSLSSLSTFQAMAPGFSIVGDKRIKPALAALARRRYPTRLIDNIPLAFDAPQEDEFAIASLLPLSFLHSFSFPRHAEDFFEKYVLFHDLPASARALWAKTYVNLLRKVTFMTGGKRLVIKNCAHSGRIRTLLELFPKAKFIHIHRNPYEVFVSTVHMHKTVLPRSQMQDVDGDRIEQHVLLFYRRLMKQFLDDKAAIPAGNVVEVRYEDLETSPLQQLERIYAALGLPGFDEALPEFARYVESVAEYRKNAYKMDEDVVAKVNDVWGFAFDEWGYDRMGTVASPEEESILSAKPSGRDGA